MNSAFIGQNINFAINLLASLALFSVFWLIFDAWTQRKKFIEALKWSGFLLLAIGFLLNAAIVEQSGVSRNAIADALPLVSLIFRCLGYALIVAGQFADPLMARPVYVDEFAEPKKSAPVVFTPLATFKLVLVPLLPLAAAILYWRRATTGLERHLKPLAAAFFGLAIFELLISIAITQNTANPLLYNIVAVYGPIWWVAHVVLLISSLVFANWVWRYLTKRLSSQIFIVLLATTVCIYFASTVGFSYLLLGNTKTQALSDLTTASNVLDYALTSQKAELSAQAEAVVTRPQLVQAAEASDHLAMVAAINSYAADNKLSSVVVTDGEGKVLLRSDDPDRWGDSLSDDSLVQRALIGRSADSVRTSKGVVAPVVTLVSIQPIRGDKNFVVGSVLVARTVSNAFVDGIKSRTGLDATIYAADQRSATTLKTSDGNQRAVGIKEADEAIARTVLDNGDQFSGEVSFQNRAYLAAYAPLKDADNQPVGMLLVARPATALLETATRSIELAFIIAVGLLVTSTYPVYRISKKIAGNVR